MGVYFASENKQLHCPLCGKFVQSSKKYRHGKGCFFTPKLAGAIYSWFQYLGKYICMICGENFKVLGQLTSHSLEHEATDVEAMGMSRFMLGRNC
jgi:DNA-directed RNA polymerase subunit RPC12/RpoP